jgi:6-phosphogluconolactonase
MRVNHFATPALATEACAQAILDQLSAALESAPTASLAISGGNSPKPMFERFASTPFAWERVHVFWVDERAVPPTDSASNYKLANDTWLSKVPVHAHRIRAEFLPKSAAEEYEGVIREHFHLSPGELPTFDVIHLGMGADGHTASLFPGEPLIADRAGIVAAVRVEKMHQWRVTLLPGTIQKAKLIAMLVLGADKQSPLQAAFSGPPNPFELPVQLANVPQTSVFTDLP